MDNSTGIPQTIVSTYRSHFGLLWRIMLPVFLLSLCVDIALFFRSAEEHGKLEEFQVEWHANTVNGIDIVAALPQREPGLEWRLGFFPAVRLTKEGGSAWIWSLDLRNFRSVNYYTLLLIVLCPLSFAVAQQKITAKEAWRHTRSKIWTVLGANLLLVLVLDGISIFLSFALSPRFLPPAMSRLGFASMFTVTVTHIYLLVCFSLYNPCLMLEQHSVLSAFRRSYALVKGNRLRFLLIYLAISWVASTLTSVFLGFVLLTFSAFTQELSSVSEMLLPFNFFTLFFGANVEVNLAGLPSVPTTVAIVVARGLIFAFFVPVWAIVTTRLYLERVTEAA